MATPITQRAATKYGSAPANQEVTVDAAGKNAAKFERMSPLKQVDLTRNVGQHGTPTATVGGGSPGTPDKEVKSTKIIPGEKPTSIVQPGDHGYEAWEKAVAAGAGQRFLDQEIETTETIPGTPGTDWEGTLQTSRYSTVKKPWQIRQQSRADKKTAKDLFKADLADGMDRATAKAKRNKFLQGQMQERADQRVKEGASGDNAGGRSVTGSRDTFQSEQTREQQIEMLERNANKTTAPKTDYSAKFKQLEADYNTENSGGTGFKPSGVIDYRPNNSDTETQVQNWKDLVDGSPTKMWGAAKSGKTPFKMGGYMSKNK